MVYVGDNPLKDFEAPNQMGWTTVRIRRHHSLHFELPTPGYVNAEIATLTELPQALLEGPHSDLWRVIGLH